MIACRIIDSACAVEKADRIRFIGIAVYCGITLRVSCAIDILCVGIVGAVLPISDLLHPADRIVLNCLFWSKLVLRRVWLRSFFRSDAAEIVVVLQLR